MSSECPRPVCRCCSARTRTHGRSAHDPTRDRDLIVDFTRCGREAMEKRESHRICSKARAVRAGGSPRGEDNTDRVVAIDLAPGSLVTWDPTHLLRAMVAKSGR